MPRPSSVLPTTAPPQVINRDGKGIVVCTWEGVPVLNAYRKIWKDFDGGLSPI